MTAHWPASALVAALVAAPAAQIPVDAYEIYSGISAEDRARAWTRRQVEAWNGGDLDEALLAYCPKAGIVWVNKDGMSRGYEGFARSMRRQFGGGKAAMGRLDIAVENAVSLGENKTLLTVRWSITRRGRRLMGGVSTQLWAQCDYRLRIVYEHAS